MKMLKITKCVLTLWCASRLHQSQLLGLHYDAIWAPYGHSQTVASTHLQLHRLLRRDCVGSNLSRAGSSDKEHKTVIEHNLLREHLRFCK